MKGTYRVVQLYKQNILFCVDKLRMKNVKALLYSAYTVVFSNPSCYAYGTNMCLVLNNNQLFYS